MTEPVADQERRRTREEIEAQGFAPVCVPEFGESLDCTGHSHLRGEPTSATGS